MGRIYHPDFLKWGPPPIMTKTLAQENLIERYERLLRVQSEVLAVLCAHAPDVARGKKIQAVKDGIAIPYAWIGDLPMTCQVDIIVDKEEGKFVVKLARPESAIEAKGDFEKPDEQKRLEDEGQA